MSAVPAATWPNRAAVQSDRWAEFARHRSPVQWPQWYEAAGWMSRIDVLTDSAARTIVPVWTTSNVEHYYHSPVALLTGHREQPFLADVPVALGVAREAMQCPAIVTASPYGYRGGALTGGGFGDQSERGERAGLAELAETLVAHARSRGAGLVLSHYLFDEDEPWLRALVAAGGVPLVMGADAVLDVAWDSLQGYHAWLGSSRRSYRGRSLPDPSELIYEVRASPGPWSGQRGVAELLRRHTTRFEPLAPPPADLFDTIVGGRTLPRLVFSLREPGHAARSTLVVLRRDDVLYAKFFGAAAPRMDYFPLVYTRLIGYATEHGFRRIEYGGGSHQAKLLRGARLRLAYGVLLILDERLRKPVQSLASLLSKRKLAHFTELARRWQIDHRPPTPLDLTIPASQPRPGS